VGGEAVSPNGREPIIVADAGPLIRLAAAGLLDTLRGLNRRIVLVDRVEDEVRGDMSKPFASEIADWIESMGPAILRVQTVVGIGIDTLRGKRRSLEEDALLKNSLRNSGEHALLEFVDNWRPTETSGAIVLYEDKRVAAIFIGADYPLTMMTTRTFAAVIVEWGVNVDAVNALERIAGTYDLKPALYGNVDPSQPPDLRMLPQEFKR
jgi:hypothetical protein